MIIYRLRDAYESSRHRHHRRQSEKRLRRPSAY